VWWLAALVASAFFATVVGRAVFPPRNTPPELRVFLVQFSLIPAAGFAFYVLTSGSEPQPAWLVWPASLLMLATVALGVWNFRRQRRLKSSLITWKMLATQFRLALAGRVFAVAAMTGYLFMFEPLFAAANVVANATWALAWVPRRLREAHFEDSQQLDAEPDRVWALVADPVKWPMWQVDLVDVSARPAGPVVVGTEVTCTNGSLTATTDAHPAMLESRWAVTEVMSGASYTKIALDHEAKTTLDLQNAGGATLMRVRGDTAISVIAGILGVGIGIPAARNAFHADSAQRFARLNDLLAAK
jgi:hypothetical protein